MKRKVCSVVPHHYCNPSPRYMVQTRRVPCLWHDDAALKNCSQTLLFVYVFHHERETYLNVNLFVCVSVAFLRRYNVTCTSYTLIFFVGENGYPGCGRENLVHHLGAFRRHPYHCSKVSDVAHVLLLPCHIEARISCDAFGLHSRLLFFLFLRPLDSQL